VSNITLDYEGGIVDAVSHLHQLGHRNIAYIGGPLHLPSATRRKQAFIRAAEQLGLDPGRTIDADFTVKGGYFACSKLLISDRPTGIVAGNDLTAIGVLHRAYDGGLRVPGDLSVVGFDDILFAEFTQPALTTAAIPRGEIGRVAFQALWSMLSDPQHAGREFRIPSTLIMRDSTAPPGHSPRKVAQESITLTN
jgi:LacI family transcriptional regulator